MADIQHQKQQQQVNFIDENGRDAILYLNKDDSLLNTSIIAQSRSIGASNSTSVIPVNIIDENGKDAVIYLDKDDSVLNSSSDFGCAQANFEAKTNAQNSMLFQNHGEMKVEQLSTEKALVGDVCACGNFAPPLHCWN